MRGRMVAAAIGVLACLGTSTLGAASGTAAPTMTSFVVHGTGSVPAANAAGVEEARQLAADTGSTVDRALTYSQVTPQWDDAASALETMAPDNFTSAYRTGVQDTGGTVVFVRRPSPAVLAVLTALPFDTTVFVGAPASERVLVAAANSADTIVHTVGVAPYSTSVDPRTSLITVTVAPGGTPQQLAAAEGAVRAAVARVAGPGVTLPARVVVGTAADQWQPL